MIWQITLARLAFELMPEFEESWYTVCMYLVVAQVDNISIKYHQFCKPDGRLFASLIVIQINPEFQELH